jgi:hypothetical protein
MKGELQGWEGDDGVEMLQCAEGNDAGCVLRLGFQYPRTRGLLLTL